MKELTEPIRIMIKYDLLDPGSIRSPMSSQAQRLLTLCRKMKIKWEEKEHYPFDRCWITPRTVNQKIAIVNFFGFDKLVELAEANKSETI